MLPVLEVENLSKTFTLHLQDGISLPVLSGVSFKVHPGECIVISGPSGTGKSSILKMIYGSYRCGSGAIFLNGTTARTDIARADERRILELRRASMGYVSQFLRALPRVSALDVAAEPMILAGASKAKARETAAELFGRLNLPSRLWQVPPATFSGGEQQRVNIARGFGPDYKLLLLDEPTASLDALNRAAAVSLIKAKKHNGAAILAVLHDEEVRDAIADSVIAISGSAAVP